MIWRQIDRSPLSGTRATAGSIFDRFGDRGYSGALTNSYLYTTILSARPQAPTGKRHGARRGVSMHELMAEFFILLAIAAAAAGLTLDQPDRPFDTKHSKRRDKRDHP
jgi:hypothetical protein